MCEQMSCMHHVLSRGPCRIRNSSHADNFPSLSASSCFAAVFSSTYRRLPPAHRGTGYYMTAECCCMTGIGYCTSARNEPSSTRAFSTLGSQSRHG